MANVKDLKNRIRGIKSSQKITKAMKMVAASKLRKAKDAIFNNRPYTERLTHLLGIIINQVKNKSKFPIIFGKTNPKNILIISISSERGLCGAFNSNVAKETRKLIKELKNDNKNIRSLSVGKKAFEIISAHNTDIETKLYESRNTGSLVDDAIYITGEIIAQFNTNQIDECYLIYNKFISTVTQKVIRDKLLPLDVTELQKEKEQEQLKNYFICEPSAEAMLKDLVTDVISSNLLKAILESAASEHGARMTAMDNATRNAEEIVKKLTIQYNRTRQAAITTELIEIITGAEAINDG